MCFRILKRVFVLVSDRQEGLIDGIRKAVIKGCYTLRRYVFEVEKRKVISHFRRKTPTDNRWAIDHLKDCKHYRNVQ